MLPVDELIYKLKLRLNKKASTEHQDIPDEDALFVLNQAQLQLITKKVAEGKVNDLHTILVPQEKLTPTKNKEVYTSYVADLTKLSNDYIDLHDIAAICTKGTCKNRPLAVNRRVNPGDLNVYFNNTNYKPSFEYQETFYQEKEDNLYIYTDGTFSVDEVYVSYLKYPKKIALDGIIDINTGTETTKQDCELPEILEDELLDIATNELAMYLENIPQVQMAQLRDKQ